MKNKMAWLAALLNFFLLGLGTIYNGKRMLVGVFLTIGAVIMTYVEQVLLAAMEDQTAFQLTFAGFFLIAVGCAVDGYKEAKSINESNA